MFSRHAGLAALALWLLWGMPAASQSVSESHPSRVYHIVFLKRDPARKPLGEEESKRIQSAHMANIHAMADRGVLVAAGPFDDTPGVISGVFFFNTSTLEEARKVAALDHGLREVPR